MSTIDLANFSNPWEHVRLLSDAARNEALIAVLARRAPGARVLEVGCGTGLLSCIAARLGATRVFAVEPTPLVAQARQLVAANGLDDVVEVLHGRVEELAPQAVDVAFSELLNADPFVEGVLEAMAAARTWATDGLLVPRRLRVYAALVRAADSAREVRDARRNVATLGATHGLDLGLLDALLADCGPYPHVHHTGELASAPVCVWDLEIGEATRPTEPMEVDLVATDPGPVGGAVVWFEAELDDDVTMTNPPGAGGHWGQLISAWPEERGLRGGQAQRVAVHPGPEGMRVLPK